MSIRITLRQAIRLVCFFGSSDAEIEVQHFAAGAMPAKKPAEPSPAGLYAWCADCPEEGSVYLGPTEVDDEFRSAAAAVLSERIRQVEQEGCTPDGDERLETGALAMAGACYAAQIAVKLQSGDRIAEELNHA